MSRFDQDPPSASPGGGRFRTSWDRGRSAPLWLAGIAGLVTAVTLAGGCSSNSTSSTTTSGSASTTTKGKATAAVRHLQAGLFKVGCYTGRVDGVDGPLTISAVKAFQTAVGIPADGMYGAQTKAKLVAAVSAGKRVCTSTTTTTSASSTTNGGGSTVPPAATEAITTFETANGPAPGTWVIASSTVSTVDPSYVFFRIGPAPGHQNTVQGGYGFVRTQAGTWTVTGFGSSEVGCPPASTENQIVPAPVLTEFGLSCPST